MNEGIAPDAAAPAAASPTKPLGDVIAINESLIKDHLNKVVVTTVKETLAWQAGDRETARRLLPFIGNAPPMVAWQKRETFESFRRWALAEAPQRFDRPTSTRGANSVKTP